MDSSFREKQTRLFLHAPPEPSPAVEIDLQGEKVFELPIKGNVS